MLKVSLKNATCVAFYRLRCERFRLKRQVKLNVCGKDNAYGDLQPYPPHSPS